MLRFAPLNESEGSGEEEYDQDDEPTTTKEAEEAEAFAAYNRALGLQRAGDVQGAEQVFFNLLQHPFLMKASSLLGSDTEDCHHPALPLLYLVHKNMATFAVAKNNMQDAIKSYLEAVKIDSSEVTVWFKMGSVAKQLHNYPLAKLAFEQGLQCNERHWPCLDAVITVLYALNDYAMCLEYCGRGLERDPYFTKGLVFWRQILKEQPSLSALTKELFAYCDPMIHTLAVDPSQAEQMLQECTAIRDKRRQLAVKPEPPILTLPTPITELTWQCVGHCLVELFDVFTSSDPPKSLILPLDMREYVTMVEGRGDHPQHPCTSSTFVPIQHTTTISTSTGDTVDCSAANEIDRSGAQMMEVDVGMASNIQHPQPPPTSSTVPEDPNSGATRNRTLNQDQGKQAIPMEEEGGAVEKDSVMIVEMAESGGRWTQSCSGVQQLASDTQDRPVREEMGGGKKQGKAETEGELMTVSDASGARHMCAAVGSPGSEMAGLKEEDNIAAVSPAPSTGLTAQVQQTSSTALAAAAIVCHSAGPTPQEESVSHSTGPAPQEESVSHTNGPAPHEETVSHSTCPALKDDSCPARQEESVSHTTSPAHQAASVSSDSGPIAVCEGVSSSAGFGTVSDSCQSPMEVSDPVKASSSMASSVTNVTSSATSSRSGSAVVTLQKVCVVAVTDARTAVIQGRQENAPSAQAARSLPLNTQGTAEQRQQRETTPQEQLKVNVELPAAAGTMSVSSAVQQCSAGVSGSGEDTVTCVRESLRKATVSGAGVKSTCADVSHVTASSLLTPLTCTTITTPTCTSSHAPPQSSSSPSGKAPSTTLSPSSTFQSRLAHSPSQPKFQFNTITPGEVTALLQDCVPSTPLLSTPAPSCYSSSLVERFKQTSAHSSLPSSSSSVSQALKSSSAGVISISVSGSTSSVALVTAPVTETATYGEQTAAVSTTASSSKQQGTAPVSATTAVSAEVALQDLVSLGRGSRGARRGTKRKRTTVESPVIGLEDYCIKRRSARVRNTRKEEENVDIQKLLHNLLPASLTEPEQQEEDSQLEEAMSTSQITSDAVAIDLCGGPRLEETETEDVRKYLKECLKCQGVVGLMYKYLLHLSSLDNRLWPRGVTDLYLKVYDRARDHLTFPSLYYMDFPEVCYTQLSKMALVWSELLLDSFLFKRADTVVSPVASQREVGPSDSGLFTGPRAQEDLHYLTRMVQSDFVELWGDQQTSFTARVYWMLGRLALADNQMDRALDTLDMVVESLQEESGVSKVYLPNCRRDNLITLEEVKRQQESLKRCQSLEESQRLFDEGHYAEVIDSLSATCVLPQAVHQTFKPALPERQAQLELLQDALYQLEDWGRCLLWGEVVLHEALHHYRRAPTLPARDTWARTLVHLLEGLQRVLDREANAMQLLPIQSLMRLAQNLIRIVEVNHDVSESVTEMPIASVLPWMLLYRIIKQEEEKTETLKRLTPPPPTSSPRLPAEEEEEDDDGSSSPSSSPSSLPASLMLLSVAHDYLGRNAWCTRESGIFLLFYMDMLSTEMAKAPRSVRDDMDTAFEQCVFCLYGHPNKKGRIRHLVDHNAPCIELMWEHCETVFEFFKPKTLPEFDSYKTSTVSAELHNLLRRIYALIPDTDDVDPKLNQVRSYVEGSTSMPPNFSSSCLIQQELYYLLADYYFKNKEQTKAIKFYMYDVCFNSQRFDSWAGLALAKMYQLEQKLNSMELKIDAPVHRKSIQALRCFSRAVEIDEGCRKLWIEYGSLAYQLHSHASRQLRMKLWFPLGPELLDIAMETRVEMLSTARNCFWKASECESEGREEEWLHHYMMGKVREKQRQHPRLYLEHYKQAAIYLHEEEAKYPRKILYHTNPPYLSLEALEMYYRLHVAVMKHLLRVTAPETREDMALFDRYLTEATESPFALRREKHYDTQDSVSSADDSQGSEVGVLPYSTAQQKPVYHMTPQDHTYSKQKSSGGDTSDASCCETKETTTETDGSQSSQEETEGGVRNDGGRPTSYPSNTLSRKERSSVDMMELHAETDSQVSSYLPDTKPLLYDKQISGGFIPQFHSPVGTSSTTTAQAGTPGTVHSTDSLEEDSAHILLCDKVKRTAGPMDTAEKGTEDRQQTDGCFVHLPRPWQTPDMAPTPDEASRETLRKDSTMGRSPDSSIVIAYCAEASENSVGEGQELATHCTGSQRSHIVTASASSLQKRSQDEPQEPCKRPRLAAKDTEDVAQETRQRKDSSLKTCAEIDMGLVKEEESGVDGMEVSGGSHDSAQNSERLELELTKQADPRRWASGTGQTSGTAQQLKADSTGSSQEGRMEVIDPAGQGKSSSSVDTHMKMTSKASVDKHTKVTSKVSVDTHTKVTSKGTEVKTEPEDVHMQEDDIHAREHAARGQCDHKVSGPNCEGQPHTIPAQQSVCIDLTGEASGRSSPPESLSFQVTSLSPSQQVRGEAGEALQVNTQLKQEPSLGDQDFSASRSEQAEVSDAMSGDPAHQSASASSTVQEGHQAAAAQGMRVNRASAADQKPAASENLAEDKSATSCAKPTTSTLQEAAKALEQKTAELTPEPRSPIPTNQRIPTAAEKQSPSTNEEASQKESSANGVASQKESSTNGEASHKDSRANSQTSQKESSAVGQESVVAEPSQKGLSALVQTSQTSGEDSEAPVLLEEGEYRVWKGKLLDKCVEGLHLCLMRFPTHYKSLYRLAYLYYASDTHRNLQFARDLLLGNSNWSSLRHMPANGLFFDRKANNFFNGMWKIPIDEIDRSGSFASHVNRSVQLLLEVLRDMGDVHGLLQIHTQLRKKPLDQARKYLRDGERHILAEMAHSYTLDAVASQLCRPLPEVDNTELLLSAFKAYNCHRVSGQAQKAIMLLVAAYHRLGLPKHNYSTPLEQAIQYCNKIITSQTQRTRQSSHSSPSAPSSSHIHPPQTVDTGIGTTPHMALPSHMGQSFTYAAAIATHTATPSVWDAGIGADTSPLTHHAHHSSSSALRPSRPRTMSESGGDTSAPSTHHSGLSRQHSLTSLALDLNPPIRKAVLSGTTRPTAFRSLPGASPSRAGHKGGEVEIIDLTTSPDKAVPLSPAVHMSPTARGRVVGGGGTAWSQSGMAGSRSGLHDPSVSVRAVEVHSSSTRCPQASGGSSMRGSSFPATTSVPRTPPHLRYTPPTPFSSPIRFSTISTPSKTCPTSSAATEASHGNFDKQDLASPSPNKPTREIPRNFHDDLM